MSFRYFLLLFTFFCFVAKAQYKNVKFENLDTDIGLSSSSCIDIFQDKEGYLWFGTIDGLNKFNGYDFKIYRPILNDSTSISSIRINAITEDNQGNLWIGTNNGLNFLNKSTDKFSRINIFKQNRLASNSNEVINTLFFDKSNNSLWVATNNGAVKIKIPKDHFEVKNLNIISYLNNPADNTSLENNIVGNFVKDKNNAIWICTEGDFLNKYDEKSDRFERILIQKNRAYELNHIPKIAFIDKDGDFWIGNDVSNLVLWERKKDSFSHISVYGSKSAVRDIYQDPQGLIWISTDGQGLLIYDKKERQLKQHFVNNPYDPFSLPNNQPSKIFQDSNGIFWIGSYDKGVSKLDPSKFSFGHFFYRPNNPTGLSGKVIQSVLQDSKKRIWLSAYTGGLNLFDEKNNSFKHFAHSPSNKNTISSNKILYTFEDSGGQIWVCTLDGGVSKFNPDTYQVKRFQHSENDPHSIAQNSVWTGVEDSKKRIWLGLRSEGLSLLNPIDNRFYNYKHHFKGKNNLASNFVFSLFVDSKNRLLVGTTLGLNFVSLNQFKEDIPKEITFQEVKETVISGQRINYLTEDHLGNIWVGTDSGIFKLDSALKLIKSYTSTDGLPNNLVVGLMEDNDFQFWVITKSGLSLLDPVTHLFTNFTSQDGIQGPEYQSKSIEKTDDGRIIVGGINGFNIFNPKNILLQIPLAYKPHITSFKLNNREYSYGDTLHGRVLLDKAIWQTEELVLRYNENNISFEFDVPFFKNQDHVKYAYKIQGIHNRFIHLEQNRIVNNSNLQPGNYVFEVRAYIDGDWKNSKSTSIKIVILPPYWKTWWAYTLYVLLAGLLIWFLLDLYKKRIQVSQERELDLKKLQFFINVSHEFKTPLTLILNPIDKILGSINNPGVIESSALSAQRSARRLLHLVNQLLDYRKMDVGMSPLQLEKKDIVKFCENVFLLFTELATKKKIVFNFVSNSEEIIAFFDFDKVEKIITNLISNALKFTNQGGTITVSIGQVSRLPKNNANIVNRIGSIQEGYVEIVVEDNGIGMAKEHLEKVFTRFYNLDLSKSGTGIGLNFTKALVEIHHGEISVESTVKQGSTFTVWLPLNLIAEEKEVEHIKDEFLINSIKNIEYDLSISNDNLENYSSKNPGAELPTLLIVEDNRELRAHLRDEFQDYYKVKEAVNGEEGLKMIHKYYPDLVISDVMMPKMDGLEMCKAIKGQFETCHIPIILLTSKDREQDLITGYNIGADAYLPKPFKVGVLMSITQNLLESKERIKQKFAKLGAMVPSSELTTNSIDEAFIEKTTKVILDNISDPDFKIDDILKEIGIGKSQFYRKIQAITGNNPSNFIRTIRLKYASDLLLNSHHSIKEIGYLSGFNSISYFSKTFRELYDLTPSEYVEQHRKTS